MTCKQRYENEPQRLSEWFINITDMVHRYGLQGNIPKQEVIIKEVVKHMHINLKNEYINSWEEKINGSTKCSALYKHTKTYQQHVTYIIMCYSVFDKCFSKNINPTQYCYRRHG